LKNVLIVFLGAGIGGVIRHVFNVVVVGMTGTAFPLGIMAINVIGSTLMGVVVGWFTMRSGSSQDLRLFLTTGVLGGFTTFSAFSLDTALLYERGMPGLAAVYVLASVILSLLGLFAGMWAVRLALGS
jgi:fluoride exporter